MLVPRGFLAAKHSSVTPWSGRAVEVVGLPPASPGANRRHRWLPRPPAVGAAGRRRHRPGTHSASRRREGQPAPRRGAGRRLPGLHMHRQPAAPPPASPPWPRPAWPASPALTARPNRSIVACQARLRWAPHRRERPVAAKLITARPPPPRPSASAGGEGAAGGHHGRCTVTAAASAAVSRSTPGREGQRVVNGHQVDLRHLVPCGAWCRRPPRRDHRLTSARLPFVARRESFFAGFRPCAISVLLVALVVERPVPSLDSTSVIAQSQP